uniref:Secreted protein n=2 Tax=Caenorhabditis tropicalis TaxID=1561998 RepID=A0A1I7V2R5_9PELO
MLTNFLLCCLVAGVIIEAKNTEKLTNFEKEIRRMLHRVERIKQAKRELDKINCLDEIPKHLMSKWIPDKSRFKGEAEYFEESILIYNAKPHFQKVSEFQTELKLTVGNRETERVILDEGCVYLSGDQLMKVYVENGDLFINEEYLTADGKEAMLQLVYVIPAADLI